MAFRTKKISQMDPKGSNLASTDLLEISELVSGSYVTKSITGAEIIASVPASVTAWGTITGTLSSQTDLNTALSGKVPTTRTLTINGTTQDLSADRTFTISTGITIGTTAITSGTVGRVLFEGTGNVVQESAGLTWNESTQTFQLTNGGIIQIGTNHALTANASELRFTYAGNNVMKIRSTQVIIEAPIQFTSSVTPATIRNAFSNTGLQIGVNGSISATTSTYFATTGNVLIGTATDAGYKLDVNGTARFQSDVTVANSLMKMYVTGGAIRFEQQGGAGFPIGFMQNGNFYQYIDQATLNIAFRNDYSFVMTTGNTSTINASAKMQIDSTTKGFLPPRMTTTQKNAIASPATGLMVYDTTLNLISVYNGTTWITL